MFVGFRAVKGWLNGVISDLITEKGRNKKQGKIYRNLGETSGEMSGKRGKFFLGRKVKK